MKYMNASPFPDLTNLAIISTNDGSNELQPKKKPRMLVPTLLPEDTKRLKERLEEERKAKLQNILDQKREDPCYDMLEDGLPEEELDRMEVDKMVHDYSRKQIKYSIDKELRYTFLKEDYHVSVASFDEKDKRAVYIQDPRKVAPDSKKIILLAMNFQDAQWSRIGKTRKFKQENVYDGPNIMEFNKGKWVTADVARVLTLVSMGHRVCTMARADSKEYGHVRVDFTYLNQEDKGRKTENFDNDEYKDNWLTDVSKMTQFLVQMKPDMIFLDYFWPYSGGLYKNNAYGNNWAAKIDHLFKNLESLEAVYIPHTKPMFDNGLYSSNSSVDFNWEKKDIPFSEDKSNLLLQATMETLRHDEFEGDTSSSTPKSLHQLAMKPEGSIFPYIDGFSSFTRKPSVTTALEA